MKTKSKFKIIVLISFAIEFSLLGSVLAIIIIIITLGGRFELVFTSKNSP
jgi:hypothetical protein